MQELDLKFYEQLFLSTGNANQEILNQASLKILELLNKENRLRFIISCKLILDQYPNLDPLLQKQTILYLNKAFSPEEGKDIINYIWNPPSDENIKNKEKPPNKEENNKKAKFAEIKNEIKKTCFKLLECKDETTLDLASQCLGNISIYDRGNFDDIFSLLVHNIIDDQFNLNPQIRLHIIKTIKYYFQNRINYREKHNFSQKFLYSFSLLLTGIIKILNNFQQFDERFIFEIFETLAAFVPVQPTYFFFALIYGNDKMKEDNKNKMRDIFGSIFSIAQKYPYNEDIFKSFHHFFFSLFHSPYKYINEISPDKHKDIFSEFSVLFDEYINKINFLTIFPPTNVSYIAIDFWNEIGEYEKKKKEKIVKNSNFEYYAKEHQIENQFDFENDFPNPPLFYVFDHYRASLLPLIIKSMEIVDPEKADSDDLSDFESNSNDIHIYATSVVRYFFYFNPPATAQYIFDYFHDTLSQGTNFWNIRQAQMQMIISICSLYDDNKPFQPVLDFIKSISGWMIQTINDYKDKNIVLNTTLLAFTTAFKYYNLFINPDMMMQLLQIICNICKEIPSQNIVQCCIELVKQIVSCFDGRDPNSQLKMIYPAINDFISIIYNRPDFLNSKYFSDLFSLKETIIDHTNPNINNEIIIEVMNNSFRVCQETQNLYIFLSDLHVFSIIMADYGEHFISQGLEVSSRLFGLLNGTNPTIIEDCLSCLINIISGLKIKAELLIPQLKEQLLNAYRSQSPGIIIQVNRVIGSLFKNTGPMMFDILRSSVDSIVNQIDAALSQSEYSIYFFRRIHYLVFPLAQILKSIPPQEPICGQLRDHLFIQFNKVLNFFKFQDKNDQNIFLEAITFGFAAVIHASSFDVKFLRDHKMELFSIANLINSLDNKSDDLLSAFCKFMKYSIRVMSKDAVLKFKMKNKENIKVLIWAECSSVPKLKFKAKNLINDLLRPKSSK